MFFGLLKGCNVINPPTFESEGRIKGTRVLKSKTVEAAGERLLLASHVSRCLRALIRLAQQERLSELNRSEPRCECRRVFSTLIASFRLDWLSNR